MARPGFLRWVLGVGVAVAAGAVLWIFVGRPAYERESGKRHWRDAMAEAPECIYRWENVRRLQTVLRPGSKPEENHWYTSVYYEQVYDANRRERFIALYSGKAPRLDTCENKLSDRYGSAQTLDAQNPPVAMTMYKGNFVLQTTDDPNRGVALDQLPLLSGPRSPVETKK